MEQKKIENKNKFGLNKSIKFSIWVTFIYSIFVYGDFKSKLNLFGGSPNDFAGLGSLFIIAVFIIPFLIITFGKNIIMYNLFNYFKTKKKLFAFFVGILFLEFSILHFIETPSIKYYEIVIKNEFFNKFYCEDLPIKYKEYKTLSNHYVDKNGLKINLLINSTNTIKYSIINPNNLILETRNDTLIKLYKLNDLGVITDKFDITNVYEDQFFNGYLINTEEDFYTNWGFDGDRLKKNIEIENEKLSWNQTEQKDFFLKIIKKNNLYFIDEINNNISQTKKDRLKDYYRIFHLENGKWKYFYSNIDRINYFDFEYVQKVSLSSLNLQKTKFYSNIFYHYSKSEDDIQEATDDYTNTEIPNINKNIQYLYFQNISRDNDLIKGNLYYDLIVGKDTLKFKEKLELSTEIKKYPIIINDKIIGYLDENPFYYYSNNKLNFQLFTNDLTMVYIINN